MKSLVSILVVLLWLVAASSSSWASGKEIPQATIQSYCQPQSVAIGEPFTLTVDIVHSAQQRVLLDRPSSGSDVQLGDRWIMLEDRKVLSLPLRDQPGMKLTQVSWRLFGLEPGDYGLPSIGADCVASGAVQRLDAVGATLAVRTELVEGEDEARALEGFRSEYPVVTDRVSLLLRWVGIVALACVLLLVAFLLKRRAAKPPVKAQAGPLERLAAIDPAAEQQAQEAFYLLSRVVRESIDEQAGARLDGLTDEEWIEHRRGQNGVASERIERAAKLLQSCEKVKYGAESPTRWAVEEALTEAKELCSSAPAAVADPTEASA